MVQPLAQLAGLPLLLLVAVLFLLRFNVELETSSPMTLLLTKRGTPGVLHPAESSPCMR